MKITKAIGMLLAAGALVFALAGTSSAVTNWATVYDHPAYSAATNDASYWGSDCTKIDGPFDGNTWTADQNYGWVIVKVGSNESVADPLTRFKDVMAGQVVWPDSNGNNQYDSGDKDSISHIIVCDPSSSSTSSQSSASSESSTSSSSSSETSFTGSQSGESSSSAASHPLPPTSAFGDGSGPTDHTWMLVAAAGMLLGSLLVLAPARVKIRR